MSVIHGGSALMNVITFGADPSGKNDSSEAVKKALNEIPEGGVLYFPRGTYLIEDPITVSSSHTVICGDDKSSKIIFRREQTAEDTNKTASLFAFTDGITDILIEDITLEYEGCFFEKPGESYSGKVSALNFGVCSDVTVRNTEITKFNACGAAFYGDPNNYSKRITVENSHMHHNRVAGVLYGYTDGLCLINNTFTYHGSPLDGGTGYGCAGFSGAKPLNTQIIGNRCSFNCRKGIDLHAGEYTVIEGNICESNVMYGIYLEGSRSGNAVIRGNIIRSMNVDELHYLPIYSWIEGIAFGTASEPVDSNTERNFIVSENEITGFSFAKGCAYPIHGYYMQHCGMIQIKDNIISGGRITYGIVLYGRKYHTSPSRNRLSIGGNQIRCDECTTSPYAFSNFDTLDFYHNSFYACKSSAPFLMLAPDNDYGTAFVTNNNFYTENLTMYDKSVLSGKILPEDSGRLLINTLDGKGKFDFPAVINGNIINKTVI